MYQALYRKYRPRFFDDIVGQEHITTAIKNEIACGRISHAYLFTGSRGTGKTTCAKIISKAVCCLNPQDGNPCCECDVCKGIENGSILDILEIDAASNNGVDDIRQLREEAFFLPATAKYRVYIIDETHMLSTAAFNALLKIMEEPPAHVIFILATTEVHKVPATILSRCQRFDFRRIPSDIIAKRIEFVCKEENINIDKDATELIARIADGGLRDALSILDICRSYSENVDTQTVLLATGMTEENALFSLADAILENDIPKGINIIDEMHNSSADFKRICTQLLEHFRNLMLAKASSNLKDLVVCTKEKEELLKNQADKFKMSHLIYCIDTISQTIGSTSSGSGQKTLTEMAFIKMCDPSLDESQKAILTRLDKIEEKIISGNFLSQSTEAQPQNVNTSTSTTKEEKVVPKQEEPIYTEKVKNLKSAVPFNEWQKVLAKLEKSNNALHGSLVNSLAYVSGNLLLIDSQNEFFFQLMRSNDYTKESLREAIFAVTGKKFGLGPYKKENYEVKKEVNPLDEIAQLAKESGIDVNIK